MANPDKQSVIPTAEFTGAAPNAAFTAGGLWTFGDVPEDHQARILKIAFKGLTSVVSWTWKLQHSDYGSLAYDGQTANFTVTKTASDTGGASGVIMSDTDGGADGTLVLNQVSGTFANDLVLIDDNGTPGAAVVNGVLTPAETLFVPQGSALEYVEYFDNNDGLVPNDLNGTPRPLLFKTTTLVGGGWAEVEFDYVKVRK